MCLWGMQTCIFPHCISLPPLQCHHTGGRERGRKGGREGGGRREGAREGGGREGGREGEREGVRREGGGEMEEALMQYILNIPMHQSGLLVPCSNTASLRVSRSS